MESYKIIKQGIRKKIIHEGGAYDTKNFRYRIDDNGELIRCRIEYLDRLLPSHIVLWQPANTKYKD
jgi:hypothetical protein